MTTVSVQSAKRGSCDARSPGNPGPRFAARRRVLLVVSVALLLGVALAANYGPVRHYLDARDRLEIRTAEVEGLKKRNAELRAQVAKLSQPAHLEDLARRELTYALPDEEVYIVTSEPGDTPVGSGNAGAGVGGSILTPGGAAGASELGVGSHQAQPTTSSSAVVEESGTSGKQASGASEAGPGILERILSAISNLF